MQQLLHYAPHCYSIRTIRHVITEPEFVHCAVRLECFKLILFNLVFKELMYN
jgi:hypothetical protein